MKQLFPGYYPAVGDDIDLQVEKTLVVFDANVLLNLYRYPANASKDLLAVMDGLSDRKWIPFHAAMEYHRNRLVVIAEQNRRFREAKSVVEKAISSLEGELGKLQLQKRHSTIDPTSVLESMRNASQEFASTLQDLEDKHKDVTDDDPIRDNLNELFASKIGQAPPNQEWIDKIQEEGKLRYDQKLPPGYRDQSKEGETFNHGGLQYANEYGDLILWKQLLEKCISDEIKQLVFVTDDDKDDWWYVVDSGGKRRIGPRPELTDEVIRTTTVETFAMLSSDRFAQRFSQLLNITLETTTVTQVRDVKSTLTNEVEVRCPSCGDSSTENVGNSAGSSAVHFCDGCGKRYHVHRRGDGSVFCREWGGATSQPERVQANCPTCGHTVPAVVREGFDDTERYCMNCCTLLKIDRDGQVIKSTPSLALTAASQVEDDGITYLECPNCPGAPRVRTIWGNGTTARAVCRECSALVESLR
jgi:uncharacterized protein (DUF983 family)